MKNLIGVVVFLFSFGAMSSTTWAMRYDDKDRESSNVEDRRGESGSPSTNAPQNTPQYGDNLPSNSGAKKNEMDRQLDHFAQQILAVTEQKEPLLNSVRQHVCPATLSDFARSYSATVYEGLMAKGNPASLVMKGEGIYLHLRPVDADACNRQFTDSIRDHATNVGKLKKNLEDYYKEDRDDLERRSASLQEFLARVQQAEKADAARQTGNAAASAQGSCSSVIRETKRRMDGFVQSYDNIYREFSKDEAALQAQIKELENQCHDQTSAKQKAPKK